VILQKKAKTGEIEGGCRRGAVDQGRRQKKLQNNIFYHGKMTLVQQNKLILLLDYEKLYEKHKLFIWSILAG
jgi:hypothetical protein